MSLWGWMFVLFAVVWFLTLVTIGWADAMMAKRDRERLELREFHEKIDAMRRMADREGDA